MQILARIVLNRRGLWAGIARQVPEFMTSSVVEDNTRSLTIIGDNPVGRRYCIAEFKAEALCQFDANIRVPTSATGNLRDTSRKSIAAYNLAKS